MIAAVCQAPPPSAGFLGGVLDFVDCQAQSIGANGYEALAAPGSTLSLLLTGFLTLFVALIGYRMLFGQGPTVREGVLALVKIGIVLALATSWAAYRVLVYDVALRGPAEIASTIGGSAALPGAGGGLVARLGFADQAFVSLAILGTGDTTSPPQPRTDAAGQAVAPQPFPGFDSFAIGGARILYLAGAIGALASVRLAAGLLLALGPFFIAFLLFEGTRGLFVGWIRALGAAALGALGIAIALGLELALIEPRLAELNAIRAAGQPIPGAAVELFVIALVFAILLIAMVIAVARVAMAFRLPDGWRTAPARLAAAVRGGELRVAVPSGQAGAAPAEGRSRAAQVVDAVAASQRREAGGATTVMAFASSGAEQSRRAAPHQAPRDVPVAVAMPIGQTYRRRTRGRISASAGRRDS